MKIGELLYEMYNRKASDLVLKVDSPPLFRIFGSLVPLDSAPLTEGETQALLSNILTSEQREKFHRKLELDLAVTVPNLCRFRVNVFQQRGHVGFVFRLIPNKIPAHEELGLPQVVKDFSMRPRGMVLVTGPAGCGKSSTIAAMVETRNQSEECHIIIVEDPIEFIYEDKKALVNQREVGRDTKSFVNALKYVLRQDPDVIVVGEMRDLETIQLAITAAETGHLVLSTLHTIDAVQTVDRIIDVFPQHQQRQIRIQLSSNLVGVISQVLVRKSDGSGVTLANEVMVATAAVRNLIRDSKTHQLTSILQTRTKEGMVTLNMSLHNLVKKKIITPQDALAKSNNPEELSQTLKIGPSQVSPQTKASPARQTR
jgi:twitching motility protein PilT